MHYTKTIPVVGGGLGIGLSFTQSLWIILSIGLLVGFIAYMIKLKFRKNKDIGDI